MRSSLVMTLIGAAVAAAALLAGCGDNDAKPVSSKLGQSCVKTADCADGLSCIANVCYSASSVGGSGGTGGAAAVGPVLGGDGESCTSRKDCEDGLACFNQRCTTATTGTGVGGDTGAPTAQLGDQGETCRVNADCAATLVCIPSNISGVGVCQPSTYGVAPTGKYCGGECSAPADCCQLPTSEAIKDCPDLTAEMTTLAVDCATAQVVGSIGARLCFLDATYCTGCTATTWKCTDNACVYNAACTVAAGYDSPKGCPEYSRLSRPLPGCNAKGLKCTGAATTGCTTDPSCLGATVVDSPTLDTCTDGECTCYAGDHACYRKCARDLDCATGKKCDKDSSLCVPDTSCTTDAQCAERLGSLDYKCQQATNTCALTCTTDRDCSGSGHPGDSAFVSRVCVDNLCTSVAGDCVDDSQCGVTGGYKEFCIARPTIATDTSVSSAVTN